MTDGVWWEGRWMFLRAVEDHAPEVAVHLKEAIAPLYPDMNWRSELEDWAGRWGLSDQWIHDQLERTLRYWSDAPSSLEGSVFIQLSAGVGRKPDVPNFFDFVPMLRHNEYVPVVHDRDKLKEQLERAIVPYLDAVEESYGYSLHRDPEPYHFRWLVQRQVLETPAEKIMSDHNERVGRVEIESTQAIYQATNRLADKIDLTLR